MIASQTMGAKNDERIPILLIAGPTASGKTSRAIAEAQARDGEVISVDSRQVYRGLDIGTEKVTHEEMQDVPHYLIDIRDPEDRYTAGDFVADASALIEEIHTRGKLPILAGGTHFYFDALLHGLPAQVSADEAYRAQLESLTNEELFAKIEHADPERAAELDPKNRRRLIRALEIINALGSVPKRQETPSRYTPGWIIIDPEKEELRNRIDTRLQETLSSGLIEEVGRVRARVGDVRLNELGLEYRIVGEYLRGERNENSLFPTLSAKLWQYARHQKAWLRKLTQDMA